MGGRRSAEGLPGTLHALGGGAAAAIGVVYRRNQLGRLLAAGRHVLEARTEAAQKALEGGGALLGGGELGGVELHVLGVGGHVAGHVLDDEAGLAQRLGVGAEGLVEARRVLE